MSETAADRLRETLTEDGWGTGSLAMSLLDQALAAERRAERRRIRRWLIDNGIHHPESWVASQLLDWNEADR